MSLPATLALALALVGSPGPPSPQGPTRAAAATAARVAGPAVRAAPGCPSAPRVVALLCELNAARAVHDRRPLRADPTLARAARAHARDMVARRYFAHVSPTGTTLSHRVARTGWLDDRPEWHLGEDLAWGATSVSSPAWIARAWMDSPRHRRVLLRARYRVVGIGIADGTPRRDIPGSTYDADFGS